MIELKRRGLLKKTDDELGSHLKIDEALKVGVSRYCDFGDTSKGDDELRSLYEALRDLLYKAFPTIDVVRRGERDWKDMSKYFFCVEGLFIGAQTYAPDGVDFMKRDLPMARLLADAGRYQYETCFGVRAVPLLQKARHICNTTCDQADLKVPSKMILFPTLCLLSAYSLFGGIQAKRASHLLLNKAADNHRELCTAGFYNGREDRKDIMAAIFLSHTGDAYMQSEDLVAASERYELSLHYYLRPSGEQHHRFRSGRARLYNAFILASKGTHKAGLALQQAEGAFQSMDPQTGLFAHSVLWYRFLRALLLFNCGHFESACKLHQEVLTDRKLLLGDTDHETLSSQYCVAVCEMRSSKLKESE